MVSEITIKQLHGDWSLTFRRGKTLYKRQFVFFSDLVAYVEHELLGG